MENASPPRHRLLTVPSSLVLVLCLFLPATQGCDGPIYPLTLPFTWPPHLLGAVALGCTLGARRSRGLALAIGLAASVSAAWFMLWLDAAALVGLPLSLAAAAWLAIGALIWWHELGTCGPLPTAAIARRRRPLQVLVPVLAALMFATFAAIVARVPITTTPEPPIEPTFDGNPFGGGC